MSAVDFWKINLPSVFLFLTFHTAEEEGSERNTQKISVLFDTPCPSYDFSRLLHSL
jgi:hypothetical protein